MKNEFGVCTLINPPLNVPAWLGRLLNHLHWRLRSFSVNGEKGWVWYYANGKLSALNRVNFKGWYHFQSAHACGAAQMRRDIG